MNIRWTVISDLEKHVKNVLAREAADIPVGKINQGQWFLDVLALDRIQVDQAMINRHDSDPLYTQKRNDFVDSIQAARAINPLIVMRETLFLVDGYARYRALKKLGVRQVQVLRQRITETNQG